MEVQSAGDLVFQTTQEAVNEIQLTQAGVLNYHVFFQLLKLRNILVNLSPLHKFVKLSLQVLITSFGEYMADEPSKIHPQQLPMFKMGWLVPRVSLAVQM